MKKSIAGLGIGLSILFIGCGQQPNIEVNDENQTEQNRTVEPEPVAVVTEESNVSERVPEQVVIQDTPIEENLTTTNVSVVEDSNRDIEDSTIVENRQDRETSQNMASVLVNQKIYFDFDKFDIRDDMLATIKKVANILKEHSNETFTIRLEGNCDEWGSDEYNYALGLKRAKSVKNYLVGNGVDESKLTIISYGESNPVCTAHNKECWQKNRRVNFTLLP